MDGGLSYGAGGCLGGHEIRYGVGYPCRLDALVVEEHVIQRRVVGILVEKIPVKVVTQFLLLYDQLFRCFSLDVQASRDGADLEFHGAVQPEMVGVLRCAG